MAVSDRKEKSESAKWSLEAALDQPWNPCSVVGTVKESKKKAAGKRETRRSGHQKAAKLLCSREAWTKA